MSQETLTVEARESRGKRNAKRMRLAGKIPAILYGHGQESVSLALSASEMNLAIRHRAHMVQLKGAATDSAILKDVQWDALGVHVLHVDLARVDADELVTVELHIALRGNAVGLKQGGVVEQSLRSVEIECPANAIPDQLELNINELELGESLTAGDLELPAKAKLMVPVESVVVACVEPAVELDEDEAGLADGAEPEVIGGKKDDEEGDA